MVDVSMTMMGSIPIPNTRFYLTSIDGKKWFITEYYKMKAGKAHGFNRGMIGRQ